MVDINKILSESGGLHKFNGIAPEGFILVHNQTLEDLKKFPTWTAWVEGKLSIDDLNKKNFDSYN